MKTKDKMDEQQRHAQRNFVISEVFNQLVTYEGYSFDRAYVFIGKIWGLGEWKIRQILHRESESVVGTDDLRKLAVILQRLIEKLN